ncbi:MAG: hypothetical protein GY711_19635 [bacterium]|nr:hypothetical protein [bacterium]
MAPDDLLASIVDAPDRDRCPGARPVVSYRDDDEADYLSMIDARAHERVHLVRRGIDHGWLAELDPPLAPIPGVPENAQLAQRWHTGRPILLRGLVDPRAGFAEEVAARRRLHDELKEPGGLRRFLKAQRSDLEPNYTLQARPGSLYDEERDLERVLVSWVLRPEDPRSPRAKDLWVKSGWLSDREDDESLRMRFSFGREGADDASRDVRRHRRIEELAEMCLPEAALVSDHPRVVGLLESWLGDEVFFTQHIAYWNAPGGGALFHHDALDERAIGGQKGVCYLQLTGSTAWLALSIEDLTRRVIEFAEYLAEGELAWVRESTFRKPEAFAQFIKMTGNFKRVRRELAKPGCGRLGRIVGRGPEFTSLLADAGHALILRAGDVLILPNHGYDCTAMHSVFCASEEPGYALSLAIRESNPPPPPPEEYPGEDPSEGPPRTRRGRGRSSRGRD